jgi:hypothetical protein
MFEDTTWRKQQPLIEEQKKYTLNTGGDLRLDPD